ncbi:MAG: family 43 glycosylhydrolase [Bacteroides stercoris]
MYIKTKNKYFYFPSTPKGEGRRGFNIGVATADNPEGPFTPEAEPIKGISGIDPCVLVDTDGEAYIYWSGRGMSVAKLKPNMKELASGPMQVQEEGCPEENFKEGPYVFKRNGKYYFTFPWVQDKTENLAYAMGRQPLWDRSLSKESSWTNRLSAAGPITTPLRNTTANGIFSIIHNGRSPSFDKNRVRYVITTHFFLQHRRYYQKAKPTLRGVGHD